MMKKRYFAYNLILPLFIILFTACDNPDILVLNPASGSSVLHKSVEFKIVKTTQQSNLPDFFTADLEVLMQDRKTRKYTVEVERDGEGNFWISRPVEAPLNERFILSIKTSAEGIDYIGYGSYIPGTVYGQVVEIYLYETSEEFAGGTGTADDPYLVASADHLNNVRIYKNAHFRQVAIIDLFISLR